MVYGYISNREVISFYASRLIKNLLNSIDTWIYVDTDSIYFYGYIDFEKLDTFLKKVSLRTSNVEFGYFKSKKNYIIYDDNGFNIKGFRKWGETSDQRESIMSEIKMLNRDKKIDNLL